MNRPQGEQGARSAQVACGGRVARGARPAGATRGAARALAILLCTIPLSARAADRVELRNGDVIDGRIVSVEPGALSVRRAVGGAGGGGGGGGAGGGDSSSGALEAIDRLPWDRVARVERDGRSATETDVVRNLELGERLWRARMRLARGDAALAEEALGPEWRFARLDGPTGLVAALVELQVALARQDHPRAWHAWLEAARLGRRGLREPALETWLEPTSHGTLSRRAVFDATSALCPSLPPFAGNEAERTAILAALDGFDAGEDRELDALRRALAAVIDPTRDGPAAAAAGGAARDDGEPKRTLEFLRTLREARSALPADRARAREAIVSQRRRLPEWSEAWSRYAVGSGLLLDATPEATLAAQVELMHLPARFAEAQPWLAASATALAAEASRAAGRADEAKRFEGADGSERSPS